MSCKKILPSRLPALSCTSNFAAHSKEVNIESLQKSKDTIVSLIRQLRTLTKTIAPTTLEDDDYVEIIKRLIVEFANANNIKVKLTLGKNLENIDVDTGLNIYRILENQLEISKTVSAKNIEVKIQKEEKKDKIEMVFIDDGSKSVSTLIEENPLLNNTIIRAEILNGKVALKKLKYKNMLVIEIPLKETAA